MRYNEIKPGPPLSRFVECFWTLEGKASSASEGDPVLPDGCFEMVLNLGDPFCEYRQADRVIQPERLVVGQMTGPLHIGPTGTVRLIGVRFHPGGALPFLRVEAHELTNRYVRLEDASSALDREVVDRVCDSGSLDECVRALERLLMRFAFDAAPYDQSFGRSVYRILQSNGLVSVDDLAAAESISARQLERRFLRQVGIGPKLLCRILRFQQVFRAVDEGSGNWASIALRCGYYDQSHLIRDFQQFAGAAPAAVVANAAALTDFFTRRHRESVFSNTPLPRLS